MYASVSDAVAPYVPSAMPKMSVELFHTSS